MLSLSGRLSVNSNNNRYSNKSMNRLEKAGFYKKVSAADVEVIEARFKEKGVYLNLEAFHFAECARSADHTAMYDLLEELHEAGEISDVAGRYLLW